MQPDITVSRNNELFLAICQMDAHSFIMAGVHDKDNDQKHLLLSVGKVLDTEQGKKNMELFACKYLCSSLSSVLQHERDMFELGETKIAYKAFNISHKQYEHLIELLIASKYKFQIKKYIKSHVKAYRFHTRKDGMHIYTLTELSDENLKTSVNADQIDKSIRKLNVINNCRTTAMDFLDTVLDSKYKSDDVKPDPLRYLPFHTKVDSGLIIGDFYILPAPPIKTDYKPEQYSMLKKLYRQLERLPKKDEHDQVTQSKFSRLKELYQHIESKKKASLGKLLHAIHAWEVENASLIDTRRGRFTSSFFGVTSTRKTINALKKMTR
jgi:hypothetical protein